MILLFAATGTDGKKLAPALAQSGLHTAFGMNALPRMDRTAEGKPFFPERPDIHFNWSHSGSFALCGISDLPIGVDIEVIRPVRPGLARRVMGDREFIDWQRCPDPEGRLFSLWTLKESCWKCTGTGLKTPFGATEFFFAPDGTVLCSRPDFSFRAFSGDGWRAAACVRGAEVLPELQWVSLPFPGAL